MIPFQANFINITTFGGKRLFEILNKKSAQDDLQGHVSDVDKGDFKDSQTLDATCCLWLRAKRQYV